MASKGKAPVADGEGGGGGLDLKLHPLVLINISDHYMRMRAQGSDGSAAAGPSGGSSSSAGGAGPSSGRPTPAVRVLGCLLGIQTGRCAEIFNSFELKYSKDEAGAPVLDAEFMEMKKDQYKKVFASLDVLGWYSTSAAAADADLAVHRKLMEVTENPLYLVLDAACRPPPKDLPVSVFESELRLVDGTPAMRFVRAPYTIETVEAERIAVDHVGRVAGAHGGAAAQLAGHLAGLHSAVSLLVARLRLLASYLTAVQAGTAAADHPSLRAAAALVRRLPALESEGFRSEFLAAQNDALLVQYLAAMTGGASRLQGLVDKFNAAFDKHARRPGRGAETMFMGI